MTITDERQYDVLEAAGMCDCGAPLEGHPDLPPPGPLHERTTLGLELTWKGYPRPVGITPGSRSQQQRDRRAVQLREAQRRHRSLGIRG